MMARIRDAENTQCVAELTQKISNLEYKVFFLLSAPALPVNFFLKILKTKIQILKKIFEFIFNFLLILRASINFLKLHS